MTCCKAIAQKIKMLSVEEIRREFNIRNDYTKEEEEQAAKSFDKLIFENFAEDKSEDWLSHGSETTPDRESEQDIFGEPDNEFKGKCRGMCVIEH